MEFIKQIVIFSNNCFITKVKKTILPLTKINLKKHNEMFSSYNKSTSNLNYKFSSTKFCNSSISI
jgi:hypothetical protein